MNEFEGTPAEQENEKDYDDYDYQERAGILQFDAGFSREEAEIEAMRMLKARKNYVL